MCGGIVTDVIGEQTKQQIRIEVMEHQSSSKCWRIIPPNTDVRIGDDIWWMNFNGYLSRGGAFRDRDIGRCQPASPPEPVNP